MNVQLEFAGLARVMTRICQISINLNEGTTFQELIGYLSEQYPVLIGQVIKPDGKTLYPSNMLNLDGKRMIQDSQMSDPLQDGDRIILMSVLAGG